MKIAPQITISAPTGVPHIMIFHGTKEVQASAPKGKDEIGLIVKRDGWSGGLILPKEAAKHLGEFLVRWSQEQPDYDPEP